MRKFEKTRRNSDSGITLVALVITVIVLLILAGATVTIALNGEGLFSKANTATDRWNAKVDQENGINTMYDAAIDEYDL